MRGMMKFGVAAAALAGVALGAGPGHALVDDPYTSYTQPAASLVMPFDATANHASFLLASMVSPGTIPEGGIAATQTHWSFWSEDCSHLVDVWICLTLHDTVVVDPTEITGIGPVNEPLGPVADLSGRRGFVTVTAYEAGEGCFPPTVGNEVLVDNALVGAYTFANIASGAAFGNDAIGLGLDAGGEYVDLPDFALSPSPSEGFLDLLTFNPATLDDSQVVLIALQEEKGKKPGEVGPLTGVTANVTYYDNQEVPTSLPDVRISCATYTSVINSATPSLIPKTVTVESSGIIRMTNIEHTTVPGVIPPTPVGFTSFVYGVHGQAVGKFGGSHNMKYLPTEF